MTNQLRFIAVWIVSLHNTVCRAAQSAGETQFALDSSVPDKICLTKIQLPRFMFAVFHSSTTLDTAFSVSQKSPGWATNQCNVHHICRRYTHSVRLAQRWCSVIHGISKYSHCRQRRVFDAEHRSADSRQRWELHLLCVQQSWLYFLHGATRRSG